MGRPKGTITPMVEGQAHLMIDRGQAEEFTGPLPTAKPPPKEVTKPKSKPRGRGGGKRQTGRSNKQVQSPDEQK